MDENIEKRDVITRPQHYNSGGIEPIKYIQSHKMGFCDGNVVKYVTRFKYKGSPIEDLKKAKQYLDWLIETEEAKLKQPSK